MSATLGAANGVVTITDDEVRAPVDLALGGQRYADVETSPTKPAS